MRTTIACESRLTYRYSYHVNEDVTKVIDIMSTNKMKYYFLGNLSALPLTFARPAWRYFELRILVTATNLAQNLSLQ